MRRPVAISLTFLRSRVVGSEHPRPRFTIAATMVAVAISACVLSIVRRAWPVQQAEVIDPFAWVGDGFREWKGNEDYYNRILEAVAARRTVPPKHLANFVSMSQSRMREILGGEKFEAAEVLNLARRNPASLVMSRRSTPAPPPVMRSNGAGRFSSSIAVVVRAATPIVLGAQSLLSPIIALCRELGHF